MHHFCVPRSKACQEPLAKKVKVEPRKAPGQETKKAAIKMIELDFASSDEEL